jgi:2-polyprenyl-6-methoxyphenol hydroxylase-like FAD-dependent oxidoreductase
MASRDGNQEPATFVISGAGIVGLVLALALKKHVGIKAEIYEKTHVLRIMWI